MRKSKHAASRVSNFNVVDALPAQEFLNCIFVTVVGGNYDSRKQVLALSVGVQYRSVGKHIPGVAPVFGIALAGIGVDEDWAGERNVFDSMKRIVSEESSALFSNVEGFEAVTAWAIAGSNFGMCRMPISRSFFSSPN